MPYGWIDGCEWRPGRNADYQAGRVYLQGGVAHETVGRESTAIGDAGYFHFLIHDEPGRPPSQFAPIDAVTWHACEWNATCVGIEVERFPGEPATAEQLFWMRYLVHAIERESGGKVRAQWAGNARIDSPYNMNGCWANHGALAIRRCDPHTDGWTAEEWAFITGSHEEDDMAKGMFVKAEGSPDVWLLVNGERIYAPTMEYVAALAFLGQAVNGPDNIGTVSQSFLDAVPVRANAHEIARLVVDALPSSSGVTVNQVESIITDARDVILEAVNRRRAGTLQIG